MSGFAMLLFVESIVRKRILRSRHKLRGTRSLGSITFDGGFLHSLPNPMLPNKLTRNIVYRIVEDTAIFASREAAEQSDQIHRAIDSSRTWGEFKKRMPPAEYESLMVRQFDENNELRPNAREPFDAEQIDGYMDGDYPPWLMQSMDAFLPMELLQRFGVKDASTINGDYWNIPPKNVNDLVRALIEMGFTVMEEPDMEFS
jgi:hypothetical protein